MCKNSSDIFEKLQNVMKEDLVFTSPRLTRRQLASLLYTNEKYLYDTLKEHLGISFSEYILAFRLDYACSLLLTANNRTVEDIALTAGFSSRKTFYRQFRKRYKMSPTQYKKKHRKIP